MLTALLTKYILIPTAFAGNAGPLTVSLFNPIGTKSLPDLISRAFTAIVWVSAFIAPIFIIYGAFQILTSAGNAEKFGAGKKTILYTVIGFLIILAAKGIVDIVRTALAI